MVVSLVTMCTYYIYIYIFSASVRVRRTLLHILLKFLGQIVKLISICGLTLWQTNFLGLISKWIKITPYDMRVLQINPFIQIPFIFPTRFLWNYKFAKIYKEKKYIWARVVGQPHNRLEGWPTRFARISGGWFRGLFGQL